MIPTRSRQIENSFFNNSEFILCALCAPSLANTTEQIETTATAGKYIHRGESNVDEVTEGLFTFDENNKESNIWLQLQKTSNHPVSGLLGHALRMSGGEVYAHELTHHIIHTGLIANQHLRNQTIRVAKLAQRHFEKKYGAKEAWRVFLPNPNQALVDIDPDDRRAAMSRWQYLFNPKAAADGSHKGYDEFLAHGLTNESFKQALSEVEVPKEAFSFKGKNLQQIIQHLFERITAMVHDLFFTQRHSNRADKEVENLVIAISSLEQKSKNWIFRELWSSEVKLTSLSLKFDESVKRVANKITKSNVVGRISSDVRELLDNDNLLSHHARRMLNKLSDGPNGVLASVYHEMEGLTEVYKPLHQLLSWRKYALDHTKENKAKVVTRRLNQYFNNQLTSRQKTALTKAFLRSDVSSLLNQMSFSTLANLMENKTDLEFHIDGLKTQIKQILDQNFKPAEVKQMMTFIDNASDDTAYYMVKSVRRHKDSWPFFNVMSLLKMEHLPHEDKLQGQVLADVAPLVDQMVSLMNFRHISADHLIEGAQLLKTYPSAMENVFITHNELKAEAFQDVFHGNPYLMHKGYVTQIANPRKEWTIGTIDQKEDFEKRGWVMQESPITKDPTDPNAEPLYMFVSDLGMSNNYQSGIASTTLNKAKGTEAYDLTENTTESKRFKAQINKTLNNMMKPRNRQLQYDPTKNYLIGQINTKGQITKLRYMMKEWTKDNMLEQNGEFDRVLARMAAQNVDKIVTPEVNKKMITELRALYDKEYKKHPTAFVEISPFSPYERFREAYAFPHIHTNTPR